MAGRGFGYGYAWREFPMGFKGEKGRGRGKGKGKGKEKDLSASPDYLNSVIPLEKPIDFERIEKERQGCLRAGCSFPVNVH